MQVIPYKEEHRKQWNQVNDASKNGTFLFHRSFMEYHQQRFKDASLLFEEKGKCCGLLPANVVEEQKTVESHGGLTYGGLILPFTVTADQVLAMFQAASNYYREALGCEQMLYKPMPSIYHRYPAEEDLYALYRLGAHLKSRGLSSTIQLDRALPLQTLRKRGAKKAEKLGLQLYITDVESEDFACFWSILTEVLTSRHKVSPVHSLAEIRLLAKLFPTEIEPVLLKDEAGVRGGCVLFLSAQVMHVQYISADEVGRKSGALDLLFSHLIQKAIQRGFRYLDFGISTENGGEYLNEGLEFQKEGFGGRGICYDAYEFSLSNPKA